MDYFIPFMRWCWWVFSFIKRTTSIRFDTYTPPWVQHTSYSAAAASLNHPDRILKVRLQMSHLHQTYEHPFIISSIFGVICCHFCILSREQEATFCSSTKQLGHTLIHSHMHSHRSQALLFWQVIYAEIFSENLWPLQYPFLYVSCIDQIGS
jgi:hypothetical protein